MSESLDIDLDRLYREGVAAIRAGDRAAGREKLLQVVERNQMHERAWLWLSTVVEMDIERIICLENVLTINPANEAARRALERLGVSLPPPPSLPSQPDVALTGLEPSLSELFPPLQSTFPETGTALPGVRLIEQGAPAVVDPSLQAALTGTPEAPPPPSEDESWRAALPEAGYAEEVPLEEEVPRRTLGDLFLVWLQIAVLHTGHNFREEIRWGGFGHIMVNIGTAGLLQVVAGVILAIMLMVLARQSTVPPLVSSILALAPQVGETQLIQPPAMLQPAIEGLRVLGLYDPYVDINRIVQEAQSNTQLALTWLAASLSNLALLYAVAAVPLLLVGQMYYATVTNMVAGWLNGQGDAFETMHALTLALVVIQFVRLPLVLILPFVPVAVALAILAGLQVYQLIMQTAALSAVQRFDPLAAMVVLILSTGVAWGLIVGVSRLLMFLLSLTSG
jgi:hypothetical protein